MTAHLLQERMRLGQVFAVRTLALEEVGNRVQPHAVDAAVEPEVHRFQNRLFDLRVVEVQVRLVRVETVPVVRAGDVVPRPVRDFEVFEDDPRVLVALVGVAPDIELTRRASGARTASPLEPRVLVGRVIADQFVDDPDPAPMSFFDELMGVGQISVHRVDVGVVGDVVAVVAHRRGVKGQQPDCAHAEVLQVRQLVDQASKVAAAVAVAVVEGAHVHLVDERVLVPERVVIKGERLLLAPAGRGLEVGRRAG